MKYDLDLEDILVIHHALRLRKRYYEQKQNCKDNRKYIRETDRVIQNLENAEPRLKVLNHSEHEMP